MSDEYNITNGAQLPRFIHKRVSLMGRIINVSPNGKLFEVNAVDDVLVKVNSNEVISGTITDSWVEVQGTSIGREINSENLVVFNNKEFDTKGHNELCTIYYSVPNLWETDIAN